MKCHAGVDRIISHKIQEIENESGPSGQRVFKSLNDYRDLIRFVGNWINVTGDFGTRAFAGNNTTDFIEVVFYGTGLNLLNRLGGGGYDIRVTVDGGSESGNITAATYSTVLNTRNYNTNQILTVVSGLSLGLHTIKIRQNSGNSLDVYGIEILNQNSQIVVNSGSLIKDQKKISLSSSQLLNFKPSLLSGAKGGRVVIYSSGGQVLQAVKAVDTAQMNLSSANHSNEEIIKRYYFREFTAGRSDDFSRAATNSNLSLAFTLDDGSTTLLGTSINSILTTEDLTEFHTGSGFLTITFIGSGLDILAKGSGSGTVAVSLDGVSIGNLTLDTSMLIRKIVSGLPYGTHTVRIAFGTVNLNLSQYLVYGPKKPTLPEGAVELADYNVMADFVANTVAGLETIATGVLRKYSTRENIYVGTWSETLDLANYVGGWEAATTTNGGYAEYTFWGTGFELRFRADTNRSNNISVSLNGLSATTANFPSLVSSVYGTGVAFVSGVLDQNDASITNGSGLRISGLPLGKYTVRLTNNTTNTLSVQAFDIITPIHANNPNLLSNQQNAVNSGSQSLLDSRPLNISKSKGKSWSRASGIVSSPSTSSTTLVPIPDMATVIKTSGNPVEINFTSSMFSNVNSEFAFVVDGIVINPVYLYGTQGSAIGIMLSEILELSAGFHNIQVFWRATSGGTINLEFDERVLTAKEL